MQGEGREHGRPCFSIFSVHIRKKPSLLQGLRMWTEKIEKHGSTIDESTDVKARGKARESEEGLTNVDRNERTHGNTITGDRRQSERKGNHIR